ncbi:hypothetical protein FF1_034984 [Malus domestica]
MLASAYKLEEAKVPPAFPLPTPPITKLKIALCQLSVTPDKKRNIAILQLEYTSYCLDAVERKSNKKRAHGV